MECGHGERTALAMPVLGNVTARKTFLGICEMLLYSTRMAQD